MNLHERIKDIDYETVTSTELAVVLEQVFLYYDDRVRGGGPIITAQGILEKYEASVRRRAAPSLHVEVKGRIAEIRSNLELVSTVLSRLEKANAQTGS
jgi:hypothetical protein